VGIEPRKTSLSQANRNQESDFSWGPLKLETAVERQRHGLIVTWGKRNVAQEQMSLFLMSSSHSSRNTIPFSVMEGTLNNSPI
jgi:hypothetical protein